MAQQHLGSGPLAAEACIPGQNCVYVCLRPDEEDIKKYAPRCAVCTRSAASPHAHVSMAQRASLSPRTRAPKGGHPLRQPWPPMLTAMFVVMAIGQVHAAAPGRGRGELSDVMIMAERD